ncbi:hypothetical protein M413DRAFT_291446 [Hebeloma cylindrosporum]|uniref:Uncharacterized protein n=1 Tax=Hebeloma cylindrosporum TaxID=76867 RepID=A0A0C3BY02_HEBCY|nr:hypothetical protein M413DRAFT_291446 [Hebeloma cylindrosporum h7]
MVSKREVYIISFKVKKGCDHWGVYFPSESTPTKGKIINISGSPYTGYQHEVKHYWDSKLDQSEIRLYLLGETDASNVVDAEGDGKMKVVFEFNKADRFEDVANGHPPPVVDSALIPTGTVSEVTLALWYDIPGMKRCQEWASEFIDDVVKQGLLPESAVEVCAIARAERNMPPKA